MKITGQILINKLFAQAVELAPQCQQSLFALEGKIIVIDITDIKPVFNITFIGSEIQWLTVEQAQKSDVKISGNIKSFLALAKATDKQQAMMSEEFNIQGNTQTMMLLQNFMAKFVIDIEGLAAGFIGDIPSHHLTSSARQIFTWFTDVNESFVAASKNYLQNESNWVVNSYDIKDYCQQVNTIRNNVDRLEARINRLNRAMK